jgi:hypothetical protein
MNSAHAGIPEAIENSGAKRQARREDTPLENGGEKTPTPNHATAEWNGAGSLDKGVLAIPECWTAQPTVVWFPSGASAAWEGLPQRQSQEGNHSCSAQHTWRTCKICHPFTRKRRSALSERTIASSETAACSTEGAAVGGATSQGVRALERGHSTAQRQHQRVPSRHSTVRSSVRT